MCLIRIGAKLCRKVDFEGLKVEKGRELWRTKSYFVAVGLRSHLFVGAWSLLPCDRFIASLAQLSTNLCSSSVNMPLQLWDWEMGGWFWFWTVRHWLCCRCSSLSGEKTGRENMIVKGSQSNTHHNETAETIWSPTDYINVFLILAH